MGEVDLSGFIAETRARIARRGSDLRFLMGVRGLSYQRAVAEIALGVMCYRHGRWVDVRYEDLQAVVDEVMIAELAATA